MDRLPEPPVVPAYSKPDHPGMWMNFDNSVSIYLVVSAADSFDSAAQAAFSIIQEAEDRYPGWPRIMYLDIEGHRNARGDCEDTFVEFQQEFWFSAIAPFLTAFELPLTGGLINYRPQRNDLPDGLYISHEPMATVST